MRRVTLAALVGLLAAGTLSAPPANAAPPSVAQAEYLSQLYDDPDAYPLTSVYTRNWLLAEGYWACRSLRGGMSHAGVMRQIRLDAGLPFSTNADVALIVAATMNFCPDQEARPSD
jgi:hypothetical protein